MIGQSCGGRPICRATGAGQCHPAARPPPRRRPPPPPRPPRPPPPPHPRARPARRRPARRRAQRPAVGAALRLGPTRRRPDLPRTGQLHTDLPRLRAGRVGAQFWSVFVPCSFTGPAPSSRGWNSSTACTRLAERSPATQLATTADEVEAALGAGRVASLMGAEGGHCIDGSLGVLRMLRRLGARYLTLTHNATPLGPTRPPTSRARRAHDFGREWWGR